MTKGLPFMSESLRLLVCWYCSKAHIGCLKLQRTEPDAEWAYFISMLTYNQVNSKVRHRRKLMITNRII